MFSLSKFLKHSIFSFFFLTKHFYATVLQEYIFLSLGVTHIFTHLCHCVYAKIRHFILSANIGKALPVVSNLLKCVGFLISASLDKASNCIKNRYLCKVCLHCHLSEPIVQYRLGIIYTVA